MTNSTPNSNPGGVNRREALTALGAESGGAKTDHGSGGIVRLRAE